MLSNIGQNTMAGLQQAAPQQAAPQGDFGMQVGASTKKSAAPADADGSAPKFGDVWNKIMSQNGQEMAKPREAKKTMGKDDFLRLMITQMKYQDPSKPFEMEKMGSELAQLSNMEQLQNLNSTIKQLVTQDKPLERLAMTNLIGKTVVVDRDRFPHTEGKSEVLHFNLPQDARQVTAVVVDSTGEVVVEQDLGPAAKGENSFNWDGLKANTLAAKTGQYSLVVKATDSKGMPIAMPKNVGAQVIGVSYEGTDPILLVGNPSSPDKVDLKQVVRIVEQGSGGNGMIPGAMPLSQAVVAPVGQPASQPGQKNFFTFEKGQGSANVDPNRLSAEARRALEVYEQQAKEAQQEVEATGFPSGLGGQDEGKAENTDFSNQQALVE